MKVVTFDEPGPPSVLRLIETSIPEPNLNEVLIEVIAIGVNRPDLIQREGNYPAPKNHSKILGLEVSGIVRKVGENVKKFSTGDKVCSLLDGGGYAEFSIAKEDQTFKFPSNLSFSEAAAIPECFITCWSNLVVRGSLKEKENVLIHGGTSGIGTTAIQLLKMFNCKIFTTVGNDEKKKFCKKLGAYLAINYEKEDFYELIKNETEKYGVDLILDIVGGKYIQKNINLLSNEGRLVNIAYLKGSEEKVNLLRVMLKRLTITGSTLRIRSEKFKKKIIDEIKIKVFPSIEKGLIKPIIDSEFHITNVVKAHERLYTGKHIGKIILRT